MYKITVMERTWGVKDDQNVVRESSKEIDHVFPC